VPVDQGQTATPSPLDPGVESRPGLLRALGPGMALAMVVGNVIGSGIFLKPGAIALDAGQFSLIMTAWVLGGVLCFLGALCFAELAVMLPRAGGIYVYLREAYGRPVAFLFGWSEFLFGRPAAIGALAVAFIDALGRTTGWEFETLTSVLLAIAVIAAMTWVNVIGVIWGGRVQAATTLVKAGFLAVLALLPILLLQYSPTAFDPANFSTTVEPKETTLATRFAAAMLAVMWAYNGWHAITPVAEEVRQPRRNIPLALFGGIGLLMVLYVAANVAYHSVLTMSEMAQAGTAAAQSMVEKLLTPLGGDLAQTGVAAMSAVVMCSTFGAINSNLLNGPRVSFAMGRDDVFVRQLGRVHVNYRTPAIAICVQAVMAALLVIASGILVARFPMFQERSVFDILTDYVIFSASIFYVLAVMAVIVLRWKHPEWERPYRTLGYPIIPLTYIAFYTWFLYYVYVGKPFEARVGLCLIALGIPVYFAWRKWAARHPDVMHDGQ